MTIPSKQLIDISPALEYSIIDHFISNPGGTLIALTSQGTGTNAGAFFLALEPGAVGIGRLSTGTTSTGSWNFRSPNWFISQSPTGNQSYSLEFRFRVPMTPIISTTQTGYWILGFGNGSGLTGVEPANGLFYSINTTDGIIYLVNKGTVRSATAIALCPPNTWIEGNITFFKNGGAMASLQIGTDAPIVIRFTESELLKIFFNIQFSVTKTLGNGSLLLDFDYLKISLGQLLA